MRENPECDIFVFKGAKRRKGDYGCRGEIKIPAERAANKV